MAELPPALAAELEREARAHFGGELGLSGERLEEVVARVKGLERATALIDLLRREVPLSGCKLLDVGCGFGDVVLEARIAGADARGVEPDDRRRAFATRLLAHFGHEGVIDASAGEALQYAAGSFDIVVAYNVLEHVEDVEAVVREMTRVARPGGHLVVSAPNYLFPYEGHYRVRWFPLTPKWIGKRVLRAIGRDPAYFEQHIHYTTYFGLQRLWKRLGLRHRNLTAEDVAAGRRSGVFGNSVLRRAIRTLRLYPNVTWLLTTPDGDTSRRSGR